MVERRYQSECFLEKEKSAYGLNWRAMVDCLDFQLHAFETSSNQQRHSKIAFNFLFLRDDASAVQLFSFVLTDTQSQHTFGYCRYTPRTNTCICMLR